MMALKAFLAEWIKIHGNDFELCILFSNRFDFNRLRKGRGAGPEPGYTLRQIQSLVKRFGFTPGTAFSLWPLSTHNVEISCPFIPRTVAGRGWIKDALLKLVSASAMRFLHPGFALTSMRNGAPESFLQGLIRRMGLRGVERCLTGNPNMLILIDASRIIKIPLDPESLARCRLSASVLLQLQKCSVKSHAPRLIGREQVGGHEIFIETRLPGNAYDTAGPRMDGRLNRAAVHLTEFHKATAAGTSLAPPIFRRLFARPAGILLKQLEAPYREMVVESMKRLEESCVGRPFAIVWLHGDYKIENILFDPASGEITGVIDWDLSFRKGLPLLDLLYLIFYDAALEGRDTLAGLLIRRLEAPPLFEPHEARLLAAYLSSLDLDRSWIHPLFFMFIVHHFARRLRINNPAERMEVYRRTLCPLLERFSRMDAGRFTESLSHG